MTFSQIQGNDQVKAALAGMMSSGRVPHAIMFHEDDGGRAMELVIAFLQMLYCKNPTVDDSCASCPACNKISKLIHPDVHFVFPVNAGLSRDYASQWRNLVLDNPGFTENDLNEALGIEGKSSAIKVDEGKALLDVLSLSALEGGYRSVVIYLPEKMNVETANRLLKIIEEPPLKTQFLLVTHAPEKVLTTIASRCQRIRVVPEGLGRMVGFQDPQLWYGLMEAILAKNLLEALEMGEQIAQLNSRESYKGFCRFAGECLRNLFMLQQGMAQLINADQAQMAKLHAWAPKCRKTFARNALSVLSRAQMLVDRNVNSKILFTDMVNRLIMIV